MRRSSIILVSALALGLIAIAVTIALAATNFGRGGGSPADAAKIAAPGAAPAIVKFASDPAPAPPIDMKDLSGQPVSFSNYPGKVILLSFWATWCPPCRLEVPELIDLQKRYPDKLQVIGISMDDAETPEDLQHVKDVVAEMDINYPVVLATPKLSDAYGGVPALPTTFVLNSSDRVVQKHTGLLPTADYDNEIRLLANLPVNAKVESFQDTGQIFLANTAKATELPGVDFGGLSSTQKREALKRMNTTDCTCGCTLTVAECRMNDDSCETSKKLAAQIIADVKAGKPASSPAAASPAAEKTASQ